jgi:hypothetical protein
MKNFIGQSTSESKRSYPVVPDEQTSEQSIPSEKAIPGRGEGRIMYSRGHYETSYSLRLAKPRKER